MGVLGVIFGLMVGQLAGAAIYRRVTSRPQQELPASIAAGLVTTVVASPIFIAFGVHRWLVGPEAPRSAAVFLAVCFGICQGALFKDRPLRPRPPQGGSGAAGA